MTQPNLMGKQAARQETYKEVSTAVYCDVREDCVSTTPCLLLGQHFASYGADGPRPNLLQKRRTAQRFPSGYRGQEAGPVRIDGGCRNDLALGDRTGHPQEHVQGSIQIHKYVYNDERRRPEKRKKRPTRPDMKVPEDRRLQEELRPLCAKDPTPRKYLVSCLLSVQRAQNLKPSTLHLAVNLLDRVLAKRILKAQPCLLNETGGVLVKLATGANEDAPLKLENIWKKDYDSYKEREGSMLEVLHNRLDWPGPLVFLDQYLARTACDESDALELRALAAFILDVSLFNDNMVSQLPSLVAAAAYCMAVTMLKGAPWTQDIERVLQHPLSEICSVVQSLCRSYEEDSRHVVEMDKTMQDMSDFVRTKLAKGFVVSLAITPVSARSREEMEQQLMSGRM